MFVVAGPIMLPPMKSSIRADGGGSDLPLGVVTFLLTDVESSTRLWREHGDAAAVMARHAALIAAAVERHDGARPLEQGEGDSTVAVFARPSQALAAALDAQRALAAEPWPEGARVQVRMALHTGEAELRDASNYGGAAIIRCARLRALASGGQVLLSAATAGLVADHLPAGATVLEVETVTLDGFDRPERVHQLCHPDLPSARATLRLRRASSLGEWPTPIVGRARERYELAELLAGARLVTITGSGGSGKTRLAHAVAGDLADRWRDGVVWVELGRLSSSAQLASAVAAACGVPDVPGVSALDLLLSHAGGAQQLIVLDNCEHLLSDCSTLVDAMLRAGGALTLLATSREPLAAAGEVTWRIPSLAVPPEGEVDAAALATFDAVRLFAERASAARPDFVLDAETAPTVAHLCRRLDGIPLAIELAAARVRALSVARLAEGLDDRFRLLTGGARGVMGRQRTLLASVEWSHGLLDEPERRLFRRLGVFTAPFTLEAAEAVAADEELDPYLVVDLLARLVDKSLVLFEGDRYRLLETLRQYALERAAEAEELAELRDRHLAWCRRRAQQWRLDREIATTAVATQLAAEAPDLLSALEWTLGPRREPLLDLLYPLAEYWARSYPADEIRSVAARILRCFPEGSSPWLAALAPIALELFFVGDVSWLPEARRALDEREDLDPLVRGQLEMAASMGPALAGLPAGTAGLRQAIEAGREVGSRALECSAAARLAAVLARRGDCAGARPLLDWLDHHLPEDAWFRFLVDLARAAAAAYSGDFALARRRLAPHLASRWTGVGVLAGNIGLWTADRELIGRAIAIADRRLGSGPFRHAESLLLAYRALLADDAAAARPHLEAGIAGGSSGALWMRATLVDVHLALGDLDAADEQLAQVAALLDGNALYAMQTGLDLARARLHRLRGEATSAAARAHEALACADAHELALATVDALEVLALLGADAGGAIEAARLLGAAEAFRERTGYCWRLPDHRRALEEIRPGLEPRHLDEGARLSIAEAVEYARRGRGGRDRPSHGWESLTPSEQRVVELVAEGLRNREIATKLFVSIATVKTHLIHVYGKLDLRTRSELAAAATRRASGKP